MVHRVAVGPSYRVVVLSEKMISIVMDGSLALHHDAFVPANQFVANRAAIRIIRPHTVSFQECPTEPACKQSSYTVERKMIDR